jgi:hypothetical protein
MAEMDVKVEVSDEDARTLCVVFGIDPGASALASAQAHIQGLARAALSEYLIAATGRPYPGGVRDLRELRLRLLAESLPGGLPKDAEVAELFQLTRSQAKNLIMGARARYRNELGGRLADRARDALRNADKGDDDDHVRITAPESLARYIEDLVSDTTAAAPAKRAESSQRYEVARQTLEELCRLLGMNVSEVTKLPAKNS